MINLMKLNYSMNEFLFFSYCVANFDPRDRMFMPNFYEKDKRDVFKKIEDSPNILKFFLEEKNRCIKRRELSNNIKDDISADQLFQLYKEQNAKSPNL